jgi:hypothetical protein
MSRVPFFRYGLLTVYHYSLTILVSQTTKGGRKQGDEAPRKLQKILGATSVSGTSIFETISENSGMGPGHKVVF